MHISPAESTKATANIQDQNITKALEYIFTNWERIEPFYLPHLLSIL